MVLLPFLKSEPAGDRTQLFEEELAPRWTNIDNPDIIAQIDWTTDGTGVEGFEWTGRFWDDVADYSLDQTVWSMTYVIFHEGWHVFEGPTDDEFLAESWGEDCADGFLTQLPLSEAFDDDNVH